MRCKFVKLGSRFAMFYSTTPRECKNKFLLWLKTPVSSHECHGSWVTQGYSVFINRFLFLLAVVTEVIASPEMNSLYEPRKVHPLLSAFLCSNTQLKWPDRWVICELTKGPDTPVRFLTTPSAKCPVIWYHLVTLPNKWETKPKLLYWLCW